MQYFEGSIYPAEMLFGKEQAKITSFSLGSHPLKIQRSAAI